jgi:hypothetical protein
MLISYIYNCHTADESIGMDTSDWVVGAIFLLLAIVILIGTLIDLCINVLQLSLFSEHTLALMQGFSLYENIGKQCCRIP